MLYLPLWLRSGADQAATGHMCPTEHLSCGWSQKRCAVYVTRSQVNLPQMRVTCVGILTCRTVLTTLTGVGNRSSHWVAD